MPPITILPYLSELLKDTTNKVTTHIHPPWTPSRMQQTSYHPADTIHQTTLSQNHHTKTQETSNQPWTPSLQQSSHDHNKQAHNKHPRHPRHPMTDTTMNHFTMFSTVSTTEDFIISFSPTKYHPSPENLPTRHSTYDTYSKSTLHLSPAHFKGYLGLLLSNATYTTISATLSVFPSYPGQHPAIPQGHSNAITTNIVCHHTEST